MNNGTKCIEQAEFCQQMLNRITEDVEGMEENRYYSGFYGYTRVQSDIVHLRRELLKLSKMVGGDCL